VNVKRYLRPALALFLLSPIVAELISGSSPPLKFFNPVLLVIQLILYGCGAILVRELALRWKKGWPSVLMLGAAYGLVEEGMALKSLFNPTYPGVDGSFGRWLGVNWIWTLGMATYHAVISIAVPILLVMLIFPDKRDRPWVKGRTLVLLGALLALDVAVLNLALAPYSSDPSLYVLTLIAIVILAIVARLIPNPLFGLIQARPPRARLFLLFGFLWTILFYLSIFVPSALKLPSPAVLLAMVTYYALTAFLFLRISGNGSAMDDKGKLALAAGLIGPFIVSSPIQELLGSRGMLIVGIAAVIFLFLLNGRIHNNEAAGDCRPRTI
jgi:hypothetical protein